MACDSGAHGCCPDNVTPAHGPNKEGCCLNTQFGCCPDNIVSANGPNFEGFFLLLALLIFYCLRVFQVADVNIVRLVAVPISKQQHEGRTKKAVDVNTQSINAVRISIRLRLDPSSRDALVTHSNLAVVLTGFPKHSVLNVLVGKLCLLCG